MKVFKTGMLLLLCLCLLLTLFAGCKKQAEPTPAPVENEVQASAVGETQAAQLGGSEEINAGFWSDAGGKTDGGTGAAEPAGSEPAGNEPATPVTAEGNTMTGISYVMIYNPLIYDENANSNSSTTLTTGSLVSQIAIQSNRAGLEEDEEEGIGQYLVSQKDLNSGLDLDSMERGGVRGALDPVYSGNDRQTFYYYDENLTYRLSDTFTCLYEGEYCYVWSLKSSISKAAAETFGTTFDEQIYLKDVEAFGPARFTENGGKINILCYPMLYNRRTGYGIGGFFTSADIFSSSECPDYYANLYGYNRDHAIININSAMLEDYPEFLLSTLSHEFQHLICASEAFYDADSQFMRSWLNEAMSAYAEELIFPGTKESGGYSISFYTSSRFAEGQSLYNFDTDNNDIGAYGAVYLFEEFLRERTGNNVFSNVHTYWRERNFANEARSLASSVPQSYYEGIDGKYSYPASTVSAFADHADEWMSKLTLEYYLEMLDVNRINWIAAGYAKNESEYAYYNFLAQTYMLYNQVNAANIEGGGRIVFAVNNGSYTIPADADDGLVYIGLDSSFNVVSTMGVTIGN